MNRQVYRVGEAEVDIAAGCVRRDGGECVLRAKTLGVLLYLMEHRGEAVPKESLISEIWHGAAVTDDVVVGCILEIRKALGDDRRHPRFLKTLPKVGYRLMAPPQEPAPEIPRAPSPSAWRSRSAAIAAVALLAIPFSALYGPSRYVSPPVRGEAAWWTLDEGWGSAIGDASGNGNSGRIGEGVEWTFGGVRPALRFDGVGGQARATQPARRLPRGSEPRTLTAWIQTSSSNGDRTAVLYYGGPGTRQGIGMSLGLDPFARARLENSPWAGDISGVSRLDDGNWRHLAATYEGPQTNLARIFVDGVEESWARLLHPPDTAAPATWSIGSFLESGTHFRGAIRDVRIYARALSATEVQALYLCSSGDPGIALPLAGRHYLLPVHSAGARARGSSIHNVSKGYAGVQFASSDGRCAADSLRGENVGHDLEMAMEVLVPSDAAGRISQAGPYFRSRLAFAGDGIIGGTSAGYWVQLQSDGAVRVKRLNPHAIVAFTRPRPGFDPAIFHRLETSVRGSQLRVWLDGRLLAFDQAGRTVSALSIPPAWEGPPAVGRDEGGAGIAFGSELSGNFLGGQQIRNLTVSMPGR